MNVRRKARQAWRATKQFAGNTREFAGSAVAKSADALQNLGRQYMDLSTPVKVAIPVGAVTAIGGIALAANAMGGGNDEPNDYDRARVSQVTRQAQNARPLHGGARAPGASANDAYANLGELAKAERRVSISKKVSKEEEAIEKLRTEYDFLRAEGRSLGGLYND